MGKSYTTLQYPQQSLAQFILEVQIIWKEIPQEDRPFNFVVA